MAKTTSSLEKLRIQMRHKLLHFMQMQELITEHLKLNPCVDCGNANIALLEFDHRDSKSFPICDFAKRDVTTEELLAEIRKCEVRCRNCHVMRHYPNGHVYLTTAHAERICMDMMDKRLKRSGRLRYLF